MRGDYKSRMEGYAIARQNGWMSINDIRTLEDMELIPADKGGDDYLVNGNMTSAKTDDKKIGGSHEESEGTENAPNDGTSSE